MQKIINELRYFDRKFPYAALEEAIENKEKMTPLLLDELDEMIAQPEIITEDYMLHTYGIYLLAQFREEKAFSRIVKLVSLPSEQVDFMFGDVLTEDLNSLLYSTFDGDLQELKRVIENPKVNINVRWAALDVYGKLFVDGIVTKEEIISYLRELLRENKGTDDDIEFSTAIQDVIIDRHLFEMVEDVQKLHDDRRINEIMVGAYDGFIDYIYKFDNKMERVDYIEDTIKAMDWWAAYDQPEENKITEEERQKTLEAAYKEILRESNASSGKVGRNDPCPCGSGKKYKKCCLKKDQAELKKGKERLAVQKKWLRDYPKLEGERQDNEVRLTDKFDEEAIEIDRLVYLALNHRPRPMWESVDEEKQEKAKIAYLEEAHDKFQKKCEEENIQSFEAYDEQHKIHYRSKDWHDALEELKKFIAFLP